MRKRSWLVKAGLLAVATVLCLATIAVADDVAVVPKLSVTKSVITYGEASPVKVKAMQGDDPASFDGTVTVFASTESSEAGFLATATVVSTGTVVTVVPKPKLSQNTWFYATYETSQAVVTTSTTEMIGVKAKLGAVTYKVPKKAGGTLKVSGMISVASATSTPTVELQQRVTTTTGKGKGKKSTSTWTTVETKSPASYGKKKGGYRPFSVTFSTSAADKGKTFRAIVSYVDPSHVMASRKGHEFKLKK